MIDWDDIDTVLLDMDGTLLDLHFDNFFWMHYMPRRYAEIHQRDEADSRRQLHDHMARTWVVYAFKPPPRGQDYERTEQRLEGK